MSANRAIRSSGLPYFCLTQRNVAFMDAASLSASGVYEASIEVRLHGRAVKLSADDELHALFSFHEQFPGGATLLEFGVTPDGRVKLVDAAGVVTQTPAATLVDDGRFHTIQVNVDFGANYARILFDGDATENNSAGGTVAAPTGSRYGAVMLFNGVAARTRVEASIRRAWVGYHDSPARTQAWEMDEHFGVAAAADLSGVASDPRDFTLTASEGWFSQTQFPYGPLAYRSPGSMFLWDVATEYTKREMPVTEYEKKVVSR